MSFTPSCYAVLPPGEGKKQDAKEEEEHVKHAF